MLFRVLRGIYVSIYLLGLWFLCGFCVVFFRQRSFGPLSGVFSGPDRGFCTKALFSIHRCAWNKRSVKRRDLSVSVDGGLCVCVCLCFL